MKTKGLIYILAVLFIFSWSACEDDNPMPKFEGDYASFMESSHNLVFILILHTLKYQYSIRTHLKKVLKLILM
jgi:hypothetical protein